MRSVVSVFITGIALLVMLNMSSCNRYIDVAGGSSSIEQGTLKFYADSNVFTYRTNIVATRDQEKVYPKFFEVALPKKIKYYEFINSSDFGFYYDKGQVVFIKIDLEPKRRRIDTAYTPLKKELEEFVQTELKTRRSKYDIKNISLIEGRRNIIITKGDATILLYNITSDNENQFLSHLNTFRFID